MPDDFCIAHGYEFMRCEKVWGAIPYCKACDDERSLAESAITGKGSSEPSDFEVKTPS